MATSPDNPGTGCLIVQGAITTGDQAAPVRDDLNARRRAGGIALRERFERTRADGGLPPDADPADLARSVTSISIQAANGSTRAELHRTVDQALTTWPTSP
ncbi:TetR family transcriptional regulator C-terminal domain-containing protein [Embleya sp. NPDC008237]|uniref:TetR family transcriptional regulator C-terminal domain-containing protein n=1 Tax=Embleya sp. NPDC008237 TaxID=3363978 RepID=UPI0036E3AC20